MSQPYGALLRGTLPDMAYPLVDADNHYYEVRDCFTRHIEARFRDRTARAVRRPDGTEVMLVGDHTYDYTDLKFDKTNPPGSLKEVLRNKENVDWADSASKESMHPAFQQRDARLALMDEQGIEATIMLPTIGVTVEHFMKDDPELTYASLRAFNRWLAEDWGWAHDDRIFSVAMLSLLDVDACVAELERVLAEGARLVHLRPGPARYGMSPADPTFDPFWARVEEAGVPVIFHIAESGYNEFCGGLWGEVLNPNVRRQTAFQWAFFHGDRPIMETLGALVYHNLFGRFPGLRILSIENGSGWVEYLLSNLDKKKGMGRYGEWLGGRFRGRPSEIFRKHVYVTPYPEDDIAKLVEFLGPDNVLFGSDYPHPEGMARPREFEGFLRGFPTETIKKIMRDNTAGLLGLA